jgi:hypothetical protein
MTAVLIGKLLLEVMFLVGIAGSAIVVAIATTEDARVLFTRKQRAHPAQQTPEA